MDDRLRAARRAFDSGDLEAGFLYYRLLRRAGTTETIDLGWTYPERAGDFKALFQDDEYFAPAKDAKDGFFLSGYAKKRIPTPKSAYLLPWFYHLLVLEEGDFEIEGSILRPDTQRFRFIVANASNAIRYIVRTFPDLASLPEVGALTFEILERHIIDATGVDNRLSAMLTVLERIKNQSILHQASLFPVENVYVSQALFISLYSYHGILTLIQDQLDSGDFSRNALVALSRAAEHLDIDFDADYWVAVTLELLLKEPPSDFDGGFAADHIRTLHQLLVYRDIRESLEEEVVDAMSETVHRVGHGGRFNVSRPDFQAANRLLAAIGYVEILPHLQHILEGLTHPDDIPPASSYASAMGRGAASGSYNLLAQAIAELETHNG
jgi:hypothetical protein